MKTLSCINPVYIYADVKNQFGDYDRKKIAVPCGKCEVCLHNRSKMWAFRLEQEVKYSYNPLFVTLTYDPKFVPMDDQGRMVVCKSDVQKFMKRLRKTVEKRFGVKIRFFLVSEYTPVGLRPHYHAIIFGLPKFLKASDLIAETWKWGFVSVLPVIPARIRYVAKYCCSSIAVPDDRARTFMLCSRRPAIGYNYLENSSVVQWHRDSKCMRDYVPVINSVTNQPMKKSLPRYYKDKIFDKDERAELAYRHRCEICSDQDFVFRRNVESEIHRQLFCLPYEKRDESLVDSLMDLRNQYREYDHQEIEKFKEDFYKSINKRKLHKK